MNYTLDDSASQLVYSSGWASQSASDPNLSDFFERTYHAVQSVGATMNLSVEGMALYIYGSKGPHHANYSVQFDDAVVDLSANAPDVQYQQLLFSEKLDPSKSVHFISLTAHPNGPNDWLDIDFVTVDTGNQTAQSVTALPNTVPVPWTSSSTSTAAASTSSALDPAGGVSMNRESHSGKLDTVTKILAIVFGIVIALVILLLLVYWFLRKRYDRHRAKEHSFRLGQAERAAADALSAQTNLGDKSLGVVHNHTSPGSFTSQNPLLSPSANMSSAEFSVGRTTTDMSTLSLAQGPLQPLDRPRSASPRDLVPANVTRSLTLTSMASSGTAVTRSPDLVPNRLQTVSDTEEEEVRPTSPARQSPRPFAFLSEAPSAFQMNFGGMRANKGDADSLKTDFLQLQS